MTETKTINALARGLDVLHLLQTDGALTLHALHLRSGIPKPSLLRILATLKSKGMVWQRMVDGAYLPSHSLLDLARLMDREQTLVEAASPVLARLAETEEWPSTLAVPRLTHMEVLESNVKRATLDHIPIGPLGFKVNLLRSSSGRAFLAATDTQTLRTVLDALGKSGRKGDTFVHKAGYVERVLSETRAQGFGLRDPDFGGDFDQGRAVKDDGRDSLAVAIRLGDQVPGTLNLTWSKRALSRAKAVERLLPSARTAAAEIAAALTG